MLRRVKATKKQKRYKRAASKADYQKMAAAATEVVLKTRGMEYRTGIPEYVLFKFPFWVVFDKTFPKGYIVDKDAETNTYKINAVKLLNWLYEKGHSRYDVKMLIKETKQFQREMLQIERQFLIGEKDAC